VPDIARACLAALGAQLRRLKEQILEFDRMITAWHRSNEMSRRLDEIPGVGLAQIRSPNNFQCPTTTLDQTTIEVPYARVRPDLSEAVFILE